MSVCFGDAGVQPTSGLFRCWLLRIGKEDADGVVHSRVSPERCEGVGE
jgi:hypothetical protein